MIASLGEPARAFFPFRKALFFAFRRSLVYHSQKATSDSWTYHTSAHPESEAGILLYTVGSRTRMAIRYRKLGEQEDTFLTAVPMVAIISQGSQERQRSTYFWSSHSRLSSGHTLRVLSQREMQWKWKACWWAC